MTKIDIFSGFLGAGKTTLIKKLIAEAYAGEKLVLIENEFGEIGVDAGFLTDAGVNITEMNSGCICCSLVGDFGRALKQVIADYSPDRIIIEPSGVGKLSDVISAVRDSAGDGAVLSSAVTVADAKKCRMYMKNFGEFFNNQIENASTIVLSHTGGLSEDKIEKAVELIRSHNENARLITTDWAEINGKDILSVMEGVDTLEAELHRLEDEAACPVCHGHHHHHHDEECDCHEHHHHHHDEECDCHEHHHHHHDEECDCHKHHHHHHDEECDCHEHHHHHHDEECDCHEHHHHHHDEECDCHEHHHHHHDEECDCHEHHHHHHHDEECDCHEHHHHHHHDEECNCGCHDHHHHHHADEVFASWGVETAKKFTREQIENALSELENEEKYGMVLRAKGIVACQCGKWLHFDYTPGEADVRVGAAATIGRLCVIGSGIKEDAIAELFN